MAARLTDKKRKYWLIMLRMAVINHEHKANYQQTTKGTNTTWLLEKRGLSMERLTTNKKVDEMDMAELAHNSCYMKEGKARYRDYDTDIEARELTRNLLKEYIDENDTLFTCDEDFDGWMLDYLTYDVDNIEGLIALFYRNLWAMADLYEKLKEYEDLQLTPKQIKEIGKLYIEQAKELEKYKNTEKQGKMLKLPCAVGDTVYTIYLDEDGSFIEEPKVEEVSTHRIWIDSMHFDYSDIGKTVFLTKEAAKVALKEMEDKHE